MSADRSGGKTALVTGASSGIGYELTKLLAGDGYDVVLVARSRGELEAFGEELEGRHGVDAHVVPSDLSEPDAARAVYETVRDEGIAVDALVNNAGFGVYGEFLETDLEQELDVIHLHVVTVTVLTKLFAREMVERGRGRILNNASTAGFVPVPTSAVYSAAKHYERSFSEALAEELDGTGVSVTTLCPGETDTGFMERGNFEESAFEEEGMMSPERVARAGYEGLMDGDRVVIPGVKNKARVFLRRVMPRETYLRAARRAHDG